MVGSIRLEESFPPAVILGPNDNISGNNAIPSLMAGALLYSQQPPFTFCLRPTGGAAIILLDTGPAVVACIIDPMACHFMSCHGAMTIVGPGGASHQSILAGNKQRGLSISVVVLS
jgi:hypothetical protein